MDLSKEDWSVISRSSLLEAVPPDVLDRLVNGNAHMALAKGEMLFEEGDPAMACYVILAGWIKLVRTDSEGHETVVEVFSKGDCFAEAAAYVSGKYPVSAEAVTGVRLLRVDSQRIHDEILSKPQVAFSMLASMSRRLHRLVDQIEQIKARNATERLASFLLGLSGQNEGRAVFELPFSKVLIAARLGMTPESLSRTLNQLRDQGVNVDGGHIEIKDCARLRAFLSAN